MMKPRFATLTAVVLLAAAWRLIPHPWNLTPITAMALFAGAHFSNRRTAYLLPIAAILISNLILGEFYSTLPFVLAGFALTVFIGARLRERRDALSIGAGALASSLLFFAITNFGHWAVSMDYPKNAGGLAACFTAAIPFFRNELFGDLAFTGIFFGGFALLERRFPALRESPGAPLRLLPR